MFQCKWYLNNEKFSSTDAHIDDGFPEDAADSKPSVPLKTSFQLVSTIWLKRCSKVSISSVNYSLSLLPAASNGTSYKVVRHTVNNYGIVLL
jgi:hypothetical protein